MKKSIALAAKVFISFALIGILLWMMRKDMKSILATISSCDPKYLAAALALFLVNTAMLGYRMKLIFNGEGLGIKFTDCMALTYMGYFFNNFMPTAVGGDLVKAYYASEIDASKVKSYASVIMDRLIGLYSFFIVVAVALVLDRDGYNALSIRQIVFSLLVAGAVLFAAIASRHVALFMEGIFKKIKLFSFGEKLDSIYKIAHDYRNRPAIVIKALLLSFLSQCAYFTVIYMFFLSLGSFIGLGRMFLVMPVVTIVSMLPSLGGLGVREGAMVAFFSPLVGRDKAFAVSILLLMGIFFISFLGGLCYFYWTVIKKRYPKVAEIGTAA